MLVKVSSIAISGLDIVGVDIETNVSSRGFPTFDIVGLAGKEVSESKHRVITALNNSNISMLPKKIVINLAPANVRKNGTFYDLPIAASLMSIFCKFKIPEESLFFGEVSLGGDVVYTKNALLLALFAKKHKYRRIFVPYSCLHEVKTIIKNECEIIALDNLKDLVDYFTNGLINKTRHVSFFDRSQTNDLNTESNNFSKIIGQTDAKRALIISAAGGHHLLFNGPPGGGKTMLCKSYKDILPPLTLDESIEVSKIYSVCGYLSPSNPIIKERPFRNPHHTISYVGMLGGGSIPRPGEISLAHYGTLFLDEISEFPRHIIDSLRQPIENREIAISRSHAKYSFPTDFTLLATTNPCPCGNYENPYAPCSCTLHEIKRYKKKLSNPILDRIDLHVFVHPLKKSELLSKPVPSDSKEINEIKKDIDKCWKKQRERLLDFNIIRNADMDPNVIDKVCQFDEGVTNILSQTLEKLHLSARSYFKIIKVSQTIADLKDEDTITKESLMEALHFRTR